MNQQDFVEGTCNCDANAVANIEVSIGFVPSAVEVLNLATGAKLFWNAEMSDGGGVKVVPQGTGLIKSPTLTLDSGNKNDVNITAFTVLHDGNPQAVAASSANSPTAAQTISKGKWGLLGWEIGSDGTIDAGPDSNTFDHDTESAAIADRTSLTANHCSVGYITVQANSAADYVTGTNTLDDADDVNYYSSPILSNVTNGIYEYTGTTTTISSGTTTTGSRGFIIGADTDIQQTGVTLYYKAWRS